MLRPRLLLGRRYRGGRARASRSGVGIGRAAGLGLLVFLMLRRCRRLAGGRGVVLLRSGGGRGAGLRNQANRGEHGSEN